MTPDAEVLILGGGCAGLSLAATLATRAPKLRVHVLEQRAGYTRDRTWCFWNTARHPFEAAVSHRWSQWRVRAAGREAVARSSRYTYNEIPADRFYELAQQAASDADHQVSLGVQVREVRAQGDGFAVDTDRGTLVGRWVFDARPHAPGLLQPVLLQRFVGWHVRTEQPCFDPTTVDLMDFEPTSTAGRTGFFYVLPYSRTEALVEATYLDHPALPPADADAAMRAYLDQRGSGRYEVLYRETGSLPMGGHVPARPGHSRLVEIGTRGGRVKASSGYAFLRIQRQSAVLAQALAAGATAVPARFESRTYGALDRIFLRALRLFPDRAPGYFLSLFRHVPPDLLVRFLSEAATPAELVRVMLALPKLDFLQAALSVREGSRA